MSGSHMARDENRRRLRARRRALPAQERRAAQARIARGLLGLPAYQRARHLAVYFSVDGEVDASPLIDDAYARGKSVFAPVLARDGLRFVEILARGPLRRNRFGIPEPTHGKTIDPHRLDLVLTPLVAFDASGTRLGMGKGYYDRSFAFLRHRRRWLRPKLIGLGFGFQELGGIPPQPWDVRLWGAVTDRGIQYF